MTPKFRAWLPRQGKMVDVTKITFVEGKVNCVFYSAKYSSDTISACYEGITFELMQSTGLTDCKGKEIYEGDIVFWQWGQLDDVGIGNNVFTNCGKKIVDSDLQTLVMLEEADRLLVLDNIYENPELVKEIGKEYHAEPEGAPEDVAHDEEDDSDPEGRDWYSRDMEERRFKQDLDRYLTQSDY